MSDQAPEYEIEAFRAGAPAAVRAGITTDVLDEVVNAYQAESAPLVIGHPTSDKPAKGVISGLRRDGDSLFVKLKNVAQDAIDGVKSGSWINRSMAFWSPDHPSNPTPGKWNARHLGLLGAASPGVPGMSKLQFSADDTKIEGSDPAPAVIFAAKPAATPVTVINEEPAVADKETPEFAAMRSRAEKAESDAKALREANEAAAKTAFEAGNADKVKAFVAAGKLTPAQAPIFTAVLNSLPQEDFTFAADDKQPIGKKLLGMIDAAKPQVMFAAVTPRDGNTEFDANDPAQIAAAANALVKDGKAPTFQAAVLQITAQKEA